MTICYTNWITLKGPQVSQTVKEVLQSLVDDGLVQGDKIGASNFFWSFPSQKGTIVQNRLDNVKETRTSYEAQLAELKTAIEHERTLRPSKPALEQLTSMKKQLAVLQEEIDAYGACDPVKVEEKRRAVTLAHEAAVRWTDNYSILLSHFTRQTGMDAQDIRRYLEIGDDYEDIF
ncbi:meiotic nuclear division protein 1 [Suillus subaureus]|uniref:Meiotic nuclear division protein 1 n=1 Tax=Suillus subaureus TaxID=48587 RepID=A0A9P7EAW0_9AGAM|nr:meiotic nuclear division protein 1 [Suillus subaureus]KAG1816108.1 meiotic nuclear division protein 1 [Suillus subaureus]